jgi:hypothetical protein
VQKVEQVHTAALDGIPNDDEVIAEATLLPPAVAAAITISLAALIPTKTTCGTGYHSAMRHRGDGPKTT